MSDLQEERQMFSYTFLHFFNLQLQLSNFIPWCERERLKLIIDNSQHRFHIESTKFIDKINFFHFQMIVRRNFAVDGKLSTHRVRVRFFMTLCIFNLLVSEVRTKCFLFFEKYPSQRRHVWFSGFDDCAEQNPWPESLEQHHDQAQCTLFSCNAFVPTSKRVCLTDFIFFWSWYWLLNGALSSTQTNCWIASGFNVCEVLQTGYIVESQFVAIITECEQNSSMKDVLFCAARCSFNTMFDQFCLVITPYLKHV